MQLETGATVTRALHVQAAPGTHMILFGDEQVTLSGSQQNVQLACGLKCLAKLCMYSYQVFLTCNEKAYVVRTLLWPDH